MVTKCLSDFKVGSFVFHPIYGIGKILETNDIKVKILFENGFCEKFTIEYLIKSSGFEIFNFNPYSTSLN